VTLAVRAGRWAVRSRREASKAVLVDEERAIEAVRGLSLRDDVPLARATANVVPGPPSMRHLVARNQRFTTV
jgi:hypothetical protein